MTELDTNPNRTPEDEPLFALFQGYEDITDEVYGEVLRFIDFISDIGK